jgi:hypothetical protein
MEIRIVIETMDKSSSIIRFIAGKYFILCPKFEIIVSYRISQWDS